MSIKILEVPQSVRELVSDTVLQSVMTAITVKFANDGVPVDTIVNYLNGLATHQENLGKEKGQQFFKVTIDRVETFVRKSKDKSRNIGTKGRVIVKNKDGEEETFDTDWIEYNLWDADLHIFNISLSNHLFETAKENIGKEVIMLKTYVYGETSHSNSSKIKFLADIRPVYSADSKPKKSKKPSKGDLDILDEIREAIESDRRFKRILSDEDFVSDAIETIAKTFENESFEATFIHDGEERDKFYDAVEAEDWADAFGIIVDNSEDD